MKIECTVIWGDNFVIEVELPDDIKFHKYCSYNDKQNFYVSIYKNDCELYDHLYKKMCGRVSKDVFGDYMILQLHECKFLSEINLISFDDICDMFNEHIKGYYIKMEKDGILEYIAKPLSFYEHSGSELDFTVAIITKLNLFGNCNRFEIINQPLSYFRDNAYFKEKVTISNSVDIQIEYENIKDEVFNMDQT